MTALSIGHVRLNLYWVSMVATRTEISDAATMRDPHITNRQAVRVAKSAAEMVESVARYLADPGLDAEGRRQVVVDQCQFTDGCSAARVTAHVIDELGRAVRAAA